MPGNFYLSRRQHAGVKPGVPPPLGQPEPTERWQPAKIDDCYRVYPWFLGEALCRVGAWIKMPFHGAFVIGLLFLVFLLIAGLDQANAGYWGILAGAVMIATPPYMLFELRRLDRQDSKQR
jgi:hypothetical protein